MSIRLKPAILIMLVTAFLLAGVLDASAWWDDKWGFRKKISFDTTPGGADVKEHLTDFPVLVRLHMGNFDFSKAKEDGSDVRFISFDDKTPLKFHWDEYDRANEIALAWVKIPRVSGGSSQDFIWVYYGNRNAPSTQDSGGTYDANQLAVYHLKEKEGAPRDSTAYNHHPVELTEGHGLPSIIGSGVSLSGSGAKIVIPRTPAMNLATGFTFSAWVRIHGPGGDARILSWEDEERSIVVGIDQDAPYCRVINASEKLSLTTQKSAALTPGTWHHVSCAVEPNKRMALFLDGAEAGSVEFPSTVPEPAADLAVGATLKGDFPFGGDLDEIHLAKVGRKTGWLKALHRTQMPESPFAAVAEEEVGESGGALPTFYVSTIVKNISLDGWMIIGLTLLLGLFSTLIFLKKSMTLYFARKDDEAFLDSFDAETGITKVAPEEEPEEFENSPIFKIYQAGWLQLNGTGNGPRKPLEGQCLNRRAVKSSKSAMERTFARESQKLNAGLIVLTMTISGGPFLGLLGTVWGVMNTFAAMAEAGEANLAAIAPGVASALATTVFGLIVAIPSLFAYNYLVVKVKSFTGNMVHFLDEFSARLDECTGDPR
ncbi:MAG: DUF2341 domain-containing protein [Deltaproteobacteria bacterium]|nr:DUF2341 domain-containing protein [Deltaproteobacteria bacterium]